MTQCVIYVSFIEKCVIVKGMKISNFAYTLKRI
jgi:hypothetical protein